MERTPRTLLITLIGIIFFSLVALFAYNRFGRYINGPEIENISIDEYQTISTSSLLVSGTVKNTSKLLINNRNITLNQDNTFSEIVVVSPGLTIIYIDINDPFEKRKTYTYQVYSDVLADDYSGTYRQAQEKQDLIEIVTNDI